mgnify:CR=1 FL=1
MESSPISNRREKRMSLNIRNLDNNTHRAYKAILTGNSMGKNNTII